MDLKQQNIMFLTRTMALGGTENVILQLCEILKPEVNNIVVCSCGGINVEKLDEMGIKHYQITDIENKNPINIIKNYIQIKKIIKKENINIIHSHHRMAALYARLCSSKKNILVANAHNTFKNKKILTKIAYKNTKIIAVGNQVRNNLVEYFKLPSDSVTVIHNAIKPFDGKISIDNELKELKNNGYDLIANVGRLSEQKGMEYFIEAAEIVNKSNKMVKFLIIGSGEDENKLKEMVKQKNLEDNVVFMGFRSDIQNIMSQVDFVVLSSLWEGLPLTPIEAFSVGKTIIATDVDGTIEIVKDNFNGLLIKPKNVNMLSEKIDCLLKDKQLLKKLEKNSMNTYINEFSFDKLKDSYLKFYQKI